uniref:Uncharacterized protein n=1 Tax=Paramormyrops kingsleyae TaxID=1676925 RepID=A0A3B3QJS7_9TELE
GADKDLEMHFHDVIVLERQNQEAIRGRPGLRGLGSTGEAGGLPVDVLWVGCVGYGPVGDVQALAEGGGFGLPADALKCREKWKEDVLSMQWFSIFSMGGES